MFTHFTVALVVVCLFPTASSECQPDGRGRCVCKSGSFSYSVGEDYYSFVSEDIIIGRPEEAADIVFIVDESKSMSKEHAWLQEVAAKLNDELIRVNIGSQSGTPNRFGLVTFGARNPTRSAGQIVRVGNDDSNMGSPADIVQAFESLLLTGRLEDGYQGINTALNGYQFRPNVAKQFILVTDENRDVLDPSLTYSKIETDLRNAGVVLNAVVNQAFEQDGRAAIGLESFGKAYLKADSAKGFVSAYIGRAVPGGGDGTTYEDYVDLALGTNGAAWNLQLLRLGGEHADSFTKAFIAVKVKEIIRQVRTCRRCTCNRDGPDTCDTYEVETQDDCPVRTVTTTAPPTSGQSRCVINGNPLNDGRVGRRYVIKRDGNTTGTTSHPSADVVFVVDESGSMVGEHRWLQETIYLLDDALRDEGIGTDEPNRYGLVGFATIPRVNGAVHPLGVGQEKMGTPTEFAHRIPFLATAGQIEDGYRAVDTALNGFQFRTGNVARQIILVTDEDRDQATGVTTNDIKRLLEQADFRFNVIVNHAFQGSSGESVLGIDSRHNGYKADSSPSGYKSVPGASMVKDSGYGTTLKDYVMLAMDTGGAAWDLNQLRRGGQLAKSFTSSFVDAKADEISEQLKVCQQCVCGKTQMECTDTPDVSNADECYRPAACKLGNDFIDPGTKHCAYSIFENVSPGSTPHAAADILMVVDESRSMIGEHRWLKSIVYRLDSALKAKSVGILEPNRFGLVAYANNELGRTDQLGTILMMDENAHRMMGSAQDFHRAVNKQLRQSGRYEDGYSAIRRALDGKNFRSGTAKLILLVTDEDRDILNSSITYDSIYNALESEGVILNAVINQGFESSGKVALGIDASRNAYFMQRVVNVTGRSRQVGYNVKSKGQPVPDSGHGTTYGDYTLLALQTGGGAWDLNRLRKGGAVAEAFTQAFVDVKVKEALSQLEMCRVCMCEFGEMLCRTFETNSTGCSQACLMHRSYEDPPDDFFAQIGAGEDVQRPVSVEVLPTSLEVCLGDNPLVTCSASSFFNTSVKVKWSHSGLPVSSRRQNRDKSNPSRQLRVTVNDEGDAGEFICTATAQGSRAIASATVSVTDNCLNSCGRFLGDGYARVLRGNFADRNIHVSIRFCPTSVITGVLHCFQGSGPQPCSQCLVLSDGFLELRWSCCLPGQSRLFQQLSVTPNECHTTTFTTTVTEAIVELNGLRVATTLTSSCWDDFHPSRAVYLGGHDSSNGYNGCMNNIEIDHKPVYFSRDNLPQRRVLVAKQRHRMMRCTKDCSP